MSKITKNYRRNAKILLGCENSINETHFLAIIVGVRKRGAEQVGSDGLVLCNGLNLRLLK